MTQWLRPIDGIWCAIASIGDSSASTECGSAVSGDLAMTIRPLPGERCRACVRVLEARQLAAGLDELELATRPGAVAVPSQTMRGIVQLDLSDVDVGGIE